MLESRSTKGHFTSICENFNFTDSDLTIQSVDGSLFQLHRKNLEICTGTFPPSDVFATNGEVTYLTETADVLATIFQFVYPMQHPDLEDMDFELVMQVAEAVEKYEVFAAANTCRLRLRNLIPEHPAKIMGHFVKHSHLKMVNECVRYLVRSPLLEVLELLPPACILPWIRYQEAWKRVFKSVRKYIKSTPMDGEGRCFYPITVCNRCRLFLNAYVNELEEISSLGALNKALALESFLPIYSADCLCTTCSGRGCKYIGKVASVCQEGIQAIPPFTDFL